MAQQIVDTGAFLDDPSADNHRTGFTKVNDNFTELYGDVALIGSLKVSDQPISMQGVTTTNTEMRRVADAVNLHTNFTIPDGTLPAVSHYTPYYPGELTQFFHKNYYVLKTGSGIYGLTGTQLDAGDIMKWGEEINEPVTALDLGDIGATPISTAVNSQSPSLTKLGFTQISAIISSVQKVYVFDADDGLYGSADNSTSASNFIDVNAEPDTSPKIKTGDEDLLVRGVDAIMALADIGRTNEFSQTAANITLPFDADLKFEQGTIGRLYFTGTGIHTVTVPTGAATTEDFLFEQNNLVLFQKRSNSTNKWIIKKIGNGGGSAVDAPYGSQYMEDNVTTTTLTDQNTWYKILGTTTPQHNSTAVDNSTTDNRLVYNGTLTKFFTLAAAISFITDTNSQVIEFVWRKNGSTHLFPKMARKVGTGSDVGALCCRSDEELVNTDFVELWARNISGAGVVLTVQDLHLIIRGVPE